MSIYIVDALTFVGSSRVAEIVSKRCRAINKKALCLGGAKNHLIAMPDCHIDMTSSDVKVSSVKRHLNRGGPAVLFSQK